VASKFSVGVSGDKNVKNDLISHWLCTIHTYRQWRVCQNNNYFKCKAACTKLRVPLESLTVLKNSLCDSCVWTFFINVKLFRNTACHIVFDFHNFWSSRKHSSYSDTSANEWPC